MQIKGVVFDLDGTLVALKLKIMEAKSDFIEKLKQMGINDDRLDPSTPGEELMKILTKDHKLDRKTLLKLLEDSFRPYELEAAAEAEPRLGVKNALLRLKRLGYKLAVASNNGKLGVRLALEKAGIAECFDAVVVRGDVDKLKPDGSPIIEAVRRLGMKPREVVYVGDSVTDIIAARRAGTRVIAILGGADSKEALMRNNPDYLIKDFDKLIDAVKALERSFLD